MIRPFVENSRDIRTGDHGDAGQQGVEANIRKPIGHELAEIAAATWLLADQLRPMLDGGAAPALENLVQEGRGDACRVAVIGQVKAGKSTLINALIRRPGFLPTDVNPWTAVVTNLHFGRPSDAGAIYQFFDETDWRHLAAGGRLFELSQRLGIELDAYMLANQVRSMRERAEERLGEQFQLLLGRQHRFAFPSADVLERYVCVGDFDSEPANGNSAPETGRFADITRSADLYFDLLPFGYPATIVDTPGINDPFLVRDEISREALKSADAYIVNAEILNKVEDLVPAEELVGEDAPIFSIDPEPSISALGQAVAVELDSQWRVWWRLWHGQRGSVPRNWKGSCSPILRLSSMHW